MCGRYVLALRPGEVRQQLEDAGMPVDEAPEDEATRQSYNVAPGYYELVYRADVPDTGAGGKQHNEDGEVKGATLMRTEVEDGERTEESKEATKETKYKLQAMKWGLVPFWTKRNPEYSSMLKTINCRDDSLAENRGMWTSMKQKKRCIIICQGFYEWLKKNGGKEKIPHYVKRKDGKLMCFAGLWDCVQYEDSTEKLYTYTIITTSSNTQLKFLHDRMPVIFENGSNALRTWLDPNRSTWTKELQFLLKPYEGELEVYAVSKEVGKVGNNSPNFVVPVASLENKGNIKNFFKWGVKKENEEGYEAKNEEEKEEKKEDIKKEPHIKTEPPTTPSRKRQQPPTTSTSPAKRPQKKPPSPTSARKPHSATSNRTAGRKPPKSEEKESNRKITSFFE
ncbi:MAG: hypothetical protein M1840_004669 [Geoglossum simile]|nr:MAG: hypothetical protein M1840_004669 [Geoglossum simile]